MANVNITERLNTVSGFRVQLRFLLDQNNAYDTFIYIQDLFGSGKVTHRGETKNVYRLTINTFTGRLILPPPVTMGNSPRDWWWLQRRSSCSETKIRCKF